MRLYAALICSRVLLAATPNNRQAPCSVSGPLSYSSPKAAPNCEPGFCPTPPATPTASSRSGAGQLPAYSAVSAADDDPGASASRTCSRPYKYSSAEKKGIKESSARYAYPPGSRFFCCRLCKKLSFAAATPTVQLSTKKSGSGSDASPKTPSTWATNGRVPSSSFHSVAPAAG